MTSAFTGFVTLLVPAIAYFTGYAYLDGYFEVFDISIQEVSPGLQQVLAHGGNFYVSLLAGIWQSYWAVPVLLGLLLSAAALFQAVGSGRQPDWLGPWRWLVAHRAEALVVLEVVIVVLSLYAAITRAHDMGAARAEFDRPRLNPMLVAPAENVDLGLAILLEPEGRLLRHLTTTTDTVFGIVSFAGDKRQWVVRIPKSSIASMQVYQD